MLLNEKIEIIIYGNQRKYYESIGYNVPTYIDKKGRIKVKNGTKNGCKRFRFTKRFFFKNKIYM